MANATMWWVQTVWPGVGLPQGPPGLTFTFGASGVGVSGTIPGPARGHFLDMPRATHSFQIVSSFWLGPDRMPPTGCEWASQAVDLTVGSITALTRNGILFGAQPNTSVNMFRTQRVFSGTTLLNQEESRVALLSNGVADSSQTASLPQFGVFTMFSNQKFDFNRTQSLGIELVLRFHVFFQGDGAATFSGVTVALPQFDIRSTL